MIVVPFDPATNRIFVRFTERKRAVTVADGETGRVLLARDYRGQAIERGGGMERVMTLALENMMREVAIDRALVRAFGAP